MLNKRQYDIFRIEMRKKLFKEIVLTGGPCAGKTTGLGYLQEKLMDRGFRVFVVPEVATMFIGGGVNDIVNIIKEHPEKYSKIEEQMLLTHKLLRKKFQDLASVFKDEKQVIIFDRGAMDVAAYTSKKHFKNILEKNHLTLRDVRDSYDAVIHLVTAARGAEKFYNNKNNEARWETLEEACRMDDKTLNSWIGHQHLRIVDNSTGFEKKMKRLLGMVSKILEIPVSLEIERKFLLEGKPDLNSKHFKNSRKVLIEQMYLKSPDKNQVRIRKRSQDNFSTYYKTRKANINSRVRNETEELISELEYARLKKFKDSGTRVIKKERHCFVYKHQYFELDVFLEPKNVKGLCLLEIELTEENDRVELPPFLKIKKEVTEDPNYTNY